MSRWLAEGRTLGDSLRRFTCLVVAGGNADATADVALGICEVQSAHRRVVLGDLFGDAERFAPFRSDDDSHGLVDAFDYGISLARIVRPVPGNEMLQFAPTGSDVPDYAELLKHPRWQRLVAAFAETEQLLVIAVPVTAAGLDELVYRTDGLVLVDSLAPAKVEPARVIATVKLAPLLLARPSAAQIPAVVPATAPMAVTARTPAPAPAVPPVRPSKAQSATATGGPRLPVIAPRPAAATARRQSSPKVSAPANMKPAHRPTGVFTALAKPAGFGAGLSILAALIIFWIANRPFSQRSEDGGGSVTPAIPKTVSPAAAASPKPADPNMIDPADSGAAVYAVQIMTANTQAGAILKLQEDGRSLPAATYAPVEIQGRTWYKVLAGAFTTRGGADSLLSTLRTDGLLDSLSPGVVVRVPFAIRVDSVRRSATVSDLLLSLRIGRQLPVYALEQRNGWVWVLAGAFETRSQADSYADKVRAAGHTADLVLRQGRMF